MHADVVHPFDYFGPEGVSKMPRMIAWNVRFIKTRVKNYVTVACVI
jgi:hypothetical protein